MLLDLHISVSGDRWSGLVFLSLEEFCTTCCDPHKGFSVVNEAEVDVFLLLKQVEFPCFLHDPTNVGNFISGSSAFYKPSLNIWKFLVHRLWSLAWRILSINNLTSIWKECKCMVVWTLFGFALLWIWNENWPFPVLWPLLSFPNLLAYWMQHFNSITF